MKINMTESHYADAKGFKLAGAGVHEVPDERGKYLVNTFPSWFKAVEGDDAQDSPEQEPKASSAPEQNSAESEATESEETASAPEKPVSKMNKDELTAYATELGIEVNDDMTNGELKESIKDHQEEE